jgi:hypothetical protein
LRGIVDTRLARDLTDLSTTQLVDLVNRAVRGPASWSPAPDKETFAPRVKEYTVLRILASSYGVRLVAGGEYIFANLSGSLACYEVASQRRIWSAKRSAIICSDLP